MYKKGWSQAQLAIKMQILGVEIEGEMISRMERNQRIVTGDASACFCRVLEVGERELLGGAHHEQSDRSLLFFQREREEITAEMPDSRC